MAHVRLMLAGGPMQVYRARNPKKSPLWQCAHRHYAEFEAAYPEAYQPRYGVLRPIIPEVVHKFLECGNLARGFARPFAFAGAAFWILHFTFCLHLPEPVHPPQFCYRGRAIRTRPETRLPRLRSVTLRTPHPH